MITPVERLSERNSTNIKQACVWTGRDLKYNTISCFFSLLLNTHFHWFWHDSCSFDLYKRKRVISFSCTMCGKKTDSPKTARNPVVRRTLRLYERDNRIYHVFRAVCGELDAWYFHRSSPNWRDSIRFISTDLVQIIINNELSLPISFNGNELWMLSWMILPKKSRFHWVNREAQRREKSQQARWFDNKSSCV